MVTWTRLNVTFVRTLPVLFICPKSVPVFCFDHRQTAIISLYSIKLLVFVTDTQRVYCAVRTEPINGIQIIVVCLSPLSPEFDPRADHMRFVVEGHWDRFSPSSSVSSLPLSFHQCCIVIFINVVLLPEGKTGEGWKPSKTQCSFGNRGALDRRVLPFLSLSLSRL
jgi:hypothetical protein